MICHECAHLVAAVSIGLKPAYIAIHPFGVNLRLKNKIICSLSDEIILYSAGPFINIVFALLAMVMYMYIKNEYLYDFYIKNVCLFFVNMLPIIPLDGGIIIKKLIMYKRGYKTAQNTMIVISCIFTALLIICGVYCIYTSHMNFSVLLLTVFMIGNIFTQREKYNIDFVQEIMYYKNKKYNNKLVRIYAVEKDEKLENISLKFDMQNYYIVFFLNHDGEVDDIRTETEILNHIIK